MKNITKKAFSIAEIIVTNAVVLSLGSISYVTMEWYIDGAKNVKVSSDLSNMLTKVEVTTLSGKQSYNTLVMEDAQVSSKNTLPDYPTVNNGKALSNSKTQYSVGKLNFINLWEKQSNFQDNQWRDYIFAYVKSEGFIKNEIAGSVTDRDWNSASLVKGNYYPVTPSDTKGLITSLWENNFEIVENWKGQELY